MFDAEYLLLEGVPGSVAWLRGGVVTKAGAVNTSALLSPAFAASPGPNASHTWLGGGATAALYATCCGGRRLVIPLRLSAPGYVPENATAAFAVEVLGAAGGGAAGSVPGGGVVAGLFQEQPGGGTGLEELGSAGGGALGLPALVTRLPARAALADATLFIDTTFAGAGGIRRRAAGAAAPAALGAAADAGGTKAASVALPDGSNVSTAASAANCNDPANPDCANYDPKKDPACQALSPPPLARCNRTVNQAANARASDAATTSTSTTPSIINSGSAYGGGGYGGAGLYGAGCGARPARLATPWLMDTQLQGACLFEPGCEAVRGHGGEYWRTGGPNVRCVERLDCGAPHLRADNLHCGVQVRVRVWLRLRLPLRLRLLLLLRVQRRLREHGLQHAHRHVPARWRHWRRRAAGRHLGAHRRARRLQQDIRVHVRGVHAGARCVWRR